MAENESDATGNGEQAAQPQVAVQKIYVRDASIEVPGGPQVFMREYKPSVNVDLNTGVQPLGGDNYQVTLTVTVTAKQEEKTVYLVEVQQAGVFQVSGFDDDAQRGHVLGAYCPGNLFPFARESVAAMVQRAGFPPFLLQPVNFDALYQEQTRRGAQDAASAANQQAH